MLFRWEPGPKPRFCKRDVTFRVRMVVLNEHPNRRITRVSGTHHSKHCNYLFTSTNIDYDT